MRLHSLDCESHLAQPGLAAPPIVCFSIGDDWGVHLLTRLEGLAWLRARLLDPEDHVVGCNIVYDLACAAVADGSLLELIFAALDAGRIHDIAIREALIDISRGDLVERGEDGIGIRYGMRLLALRYLKIDLSADKKAADSWRKRYAELDGVPIEEWPWAARRYPLRDAAFPIEIFKLQEGGRNLHDEANQVRAAFALQLMSVWGMRSNPEAVAKLRARVEAEDAKNTAAFQASGILRLDGTEDRKRVAQLVTAAYDGSPPKTAPTVKFREGQVASDRDTLMESNDPLLELYGRAGKNDKFLTTYLKLLEEGIAQPWNPQFNVLVATTRVSSNAQQFPQVGGVRECWEARLRHLICSVDYGGLELRTMSQRAIWEEGYSRMADALNAGRDCHVIAGASFMAITEEEFAKRRAALDPMVNSFRDLGKIYNFGKGGGMGPGAMVYNARKGSKGETTVSPDGIHYIGGRFCVLTGQAKRCGDLKTLAKVQGKDRRLCRKCLDVARQLDAGWLTAWPEFRALFRKASRLAEQSRYIEAVIPVSKVVRGKCGYTQWLNTPFQGLGAAATKRATWLVCREMYTRPQSPLFGSRLLLNVHDELIGEMPEDVAPEAGDRMALIMRETLKKFVPDLAKSVEAEPALSRNMSKKAATIRDSNGRLLVWEAKAA